MHWSGPYDRGADDDRHYANWALPTGEQHTETVWVCDVISRFRIQPNNRPCVFRLPRIELLIPAGPTPSPAP